MDLSTLEARIRSAQIHDCVAVDEDDNELPCCAQTAADVAKAAGVESRNPADARATKAITADDLEVS